ncbi:MAG: hypothetical protein QOH40_934 [Arthrobacter pascens]|jgi:hypothetical protein|nr:hypothetical protein [Arthrobacter pascens]
MTIAHSVPSISFGRKGSRTSATQQARHSGEPSAHEAPGGLTCSPWEGLYLHTGESESSEEANLPNPELERFLSSLMFGE